MSSTNPTNDFYSFFQYIYEFYNKNLYDEELPNCMFVIVRKKATFGHFIPERWENDQKIKSDEIAINPLMFGQYPLIEILQTIVHEMCHLWQYHFGERTRKSYHDKQWGNKMESMGLMPSNTGKPGGKKTGQQMMDYIIEDGKFIEQTKILVSNDIFKKLWYDRFGVVPNLELSAEQEAQCNGANTINEISKVPDIKNFHSPIRHVLLNNSNTLESSKKVKIKYNCSYCNANVWGKPGLNIRCNDCKEDFNSS